MAILPSKGSSSLTPFDFKGPNLRTSVNRVKQTTTSLCVLTVGLVSRRIALTPATRPDPVASE